MNIPATTQKLLLRELKALQDQPPEGIRLLVNEHNIAGEEGGTARARMKECGYL